MANSDPRSSRVIAAATNPVLRRKYVPANATSGSTTSLMEAGFAASGGTPASAKNACAATHIEVAGTVALNSTLDQERCSGRRRAEMARLSSATVIVPAAGPNSSAAAIVKVSEIEKLTGTTGMRSVAAPLVTVKAARMNHATPGGVVTRCHTDIPSTTPPSNVTDCVYRRGASRMPALLYYPRS